MSSRLALVAVLAFAACIRDTGGVAGEDVVAGGCDLFPDVLRPEPRVEPDYDGASAALFSEDTVPALSIDFAPGEFEKLSAQWKDESWVDAADADIRWEAIKSSSYVHCGVSFMGETFPDAACRLRGSPQYWHEEKKPQLKVKFNRWDPDGRFLGMRSFNLEYLYTQDAPVRDRVAMWVMRKAGLPAPRVGHVRVTMDGKDRGLYMVIEPVDREFLEAWFAEPDGNLYEGGWLKETNEDDPNICDMQAANDLVTLEELGQDHSEFRGALARIMDVGQVIRVMAAETVFPTVDNLANGSTNFYFYHHPGQGFVAIPWDLDGVLKSEDDVKSLMNSRNETGKLLQIIREIPEWDELFVDSLVEIRDGPFAALDAEVDRVCALVRPVVAEDEAWLDENDPDRDEGLADFDEDCRRIKQLRKLRADVLHDILGR